MSETNVWYLEIELTSLVYLTTTYILFAIAYTGWEFTHCDSTWGNEDNQILYMAHIVYLKTTNIHILTKYIFFRKNVIK